MQNYIVTDKHINEIKIGDSVLHNGTIKTVGRQNIKQCSFMGRTLWGDSYHIGYKPVKTIKFITK